MTEQARPDDATDALDEGIGSIAIIGMAGRFPGAASVDELWEMIREGRHAFRRFQPDEIDDAFEDAVRASKDYVAARPHLDDVGLFDAEFFGMYPREAALIDPQFRLFLEICWEALEGAGCDPFRAPASIGVFAGSAMGTYLINNVLSDRVKVEQFTSNYQVGMFSELIGSVNDTLATRVAYKLNLRGPAFTIQSACSTSALAVTQACQTLLTYGCDMALAGGVSITFPQKRGYLYQEGGMVSPDGFCRPFDADAAGTVFGSGAGVVLLKRLEDVLGDGDMIHAVIRGYGVNNDGADKVGYTAPSVSGQSEAIAAAHASAGIDPATIGYVECHGTATPLGDPIEFSGLTKAFGAVADKGFCALGSVKGNFGHLDAAAGVAGLIKAALVLRHRQIPPVANFVAPNPHIDLDDSPFSIPRQLSDWNTDGTPRRAGVSSFGVGGTNVHLVLEEAPPAAPLAEDDGNAVHILPLSARNEAALTAMRENLGAALRNGAAPLSSVAHTLQAGRHDFLQRSAVVARSREEAITGLTSERPISGRAEETPPPVIFLFPGQGAQYVGMGGALHAAEPEFARWIDQGAELAKPLIDADLRDFIRREGGPDEKLAEALRDTKIAQPALFLVEYATARLWMSRGLKPAAMIGHSVGEFVAAALSGVMSFEDGMKLVAARGRLMQEQPKGAMVSVRADAATVALHLCDGVEIAAINAPKLSVISGPFEAMDATCAALDAAGVAYSRLHTSHAFHSAMMDEAARLLEDETSRVTYHPATIPYISCVTGDWQTDEQGAAPAYWARHCRDAVRFAGGLSTACQGSKPVLLETGPGRTLSVFCAQTLKREALAAIVQSLPEHDRAGLAQEVFAEAHARLWIAGCRFDWPDLPAEARRTVALPTYPFQRQLHWIDAPKPLRQANAATVAQAAVALPTTPTNGPVIMTATPAFPAADRPARLEAALTALLADLSGEELPDDAGGATFLELGFDSLFIGQFAQKVEKEYKVKLSFRELLSNIPTIQALARHLDAELPADAVQPAPETPATPPPPTPVAALAAPSTMTNGPTTAPAGIEALFQSQLQMAQQLFAQQMQTIQSLGGVPAAPMQAGVVAAAPTPPIATPPAGDQEKEIGGERIRLYKPGAQHADHEITREKRAFIADLIARYEAKNAKSKAFTETHRPRLADPRAASGFRAEWKEMVFPVVSDRSKGARIWDVDGNEYIDLVNGMGQTAFGHAPDFVVEAIIAQANSGFAIGPQTPLAGDVADLVSELTGHQRVTFCNTGSEAVMAAMRVARAVTGRERVVVFGNDYHGQFDEVLVKGRSRSGAHAALPIAAGIPPGSVSNMTVLSYGAPESLDWIRANADDIAAVIIEPVQSRHPELRPVDFVRELRAIATQGEFALVFDEVVTGFRVHPGGMQAIWGITGDLATYGKVLGGGMPIGVLAGDSRFMDALDGGGWSYGDDSVPMVAPTFFAGTFVRHPIVLAATKAVLEHIKGEGQALYDRVAARTEQLVGSLNDELARRGIASPIHGYKSWFVTDFGSADPLGALFYPHARLQGLHVQDGYPCFLTTQHSEEDFERIAAVFANSLDALQGAGILAPAHPVPVAAAAGAEPAPASAPLTEAQTEIWLAAQAGDEASCAFNESFNLALDGPLDEAAFRRAFALVIARHDALHIRFSRAGDRFDIIPDFTVDLPLRDVSADAEIEHIAAEEARTPFDLVNGPLVRAQMARLAADRHVLVFTAHHIVCDGWSVNVIVEELAAAYVALLKGEQPDLQPALSFAAYARERAGTTGATGETEAFWLGQFATLPDLADLPTDRPRPERRSFSGGTVTASIDKDTYKRLKKAGAKGGATMFSTLLAALQVMIARLSASDDIVVAVPSAGQSLLDGQNLVGHCVNLLPLRHAVDDNQSFDAHLRQTQQLVLKAFEHQDYTYGTLVRKLGVKRDPSRLPLTEIQFNLERMAKNLDFGGLEARVTPNPKAFSNFDMFLNMIESEDGIRIDVDYNGDVFDRQTIERWLGHFRTLASAIADHMTARIGTLPLLSQDETDWLVHQVNATEAEFDQERLVYDLFAERVAERPDAIAAQHGDASITYAELDARSWQLAHLIHEKVFIPGRRVAVALDRSIDMLVTLLAIMKSGHIYVPLDPEHPEARLRQTMEAARISAVVCASDRIAALAGADAVTIRLDTEEAAIAAQSPTPLERRTRHAASAAYIIFTSGSTGVPKGVEVPHRALVNFLTSMAREPGFTAEDTLIAVTTISFDIAGLELYLPLITGGKVVIADGAQVRDGFALVDLLKRSQATILQATPTLWQMLVEAGLENQPQLKMLCGGEPLPGELARTLIGIGDELWNMYGPTETTIWSSLARIDDAQAPITIGHPIANTQLFILDGQDRIAPVGVIGELNIGGEGLAVGYFENREQTRAAFRNVNIAGVPQRLYRTGDVGRRLPDGSLQLLGRRDNQIKLRGFRIELGEIETVIGKAEGVRQCAVVAARNTNGDRQLVCHFVAEKLDEPPSAERLTTHAKAHLPTHMVPGFWLEAKELPQTANGKLDRKALEALGLPRRQAAAPIRVQPRTPMEKKLSNIWSEVLEIGEIGIEDNLYALGADSLSIFRIAARMMDAGVPLEAKHLLRHPTIGELAICAEAESVSSANGTMPHVPSLKDYRNGARRVAGAGR
ncbi:hybrid non-ribosomal peptide synthetase/type I polyketide synthase [Nitratireductor soli]|uniref:hybrid non-ribosomal peptide synthetase/type I polyketide synthase n=1 Tax=Nitratireductor soli TaxID=1670619 RepID=UPI00065E7DA6|nr:hybrid non-ribosomal peptide synthetase/type I polyketide synthase [Nitratireductor soli]